MIAAVRRYLRDERGAAAAEFTLILPGLILFIFGFIHMCLMMSTVTRLHWATEDAARCASVRSECKIEDDGDLVADKDLVEAWAEAKYAGYAPATFAYAAAACGHKVTADADYPFSIPFYSHTFELSASACFA